MCKKNQHKIQIKANPEYFQMSLFKFRITKNFIKNIKTLSQIMILNMKNKKIKEKKQYINLI